MALIETDDVVEHLAAHAAELSIAIEQDVAVQTRQRKGLASLLHDPVAARMGLAGRISAQ
jgi:hypothetical protein